MPWIIIAMTITICLIFSVFIKTGIARLLSPGYPSSVLALSVTVIVSAWPSLSQPIEREENK